MMINQHSIAKSQNESLVPSPLLVDGRSERDWLCFISEYGKLINFFNRKNHIEGDWAKFILKDPVFLMAAISKTKSAPLRKMFLDTCLELPKAEDSARIINNLFDQFNNINKHIAGWTYYMQKSGEHYDLKRYVFHEVKTKISVAFWAVQSFRSALSQSNADGIKIKRTKNHELADFQQIIWNENKDLSPYWEVLGFQPSATKPADIAQALQKTGEGLFNFLDTVIHHSVGEFDQRSLKKSRYPDTTLLRSFVAILRIHQQQLNGISQRHLDFYYKDILKETPLPATPDKAFLCAALAKRDAVFDLPAATLFDAGLDDEKKPIQFAATETASLNPASVVSAAILNYNKDSGIFPSYKLTTIAKPGELQKDEQGKILGWQTFGSNLGGAISPAPGIAIASPMLLLREGTRTIVFTLTFKLPPDLTLLQHAKYFLSTQKKWLALKIASGSITTGKTTHDIVITIVLPPDQLAIEPFLVHPDGFKTSWPMLKILFDVVTDPTMPPTLNVIKIEASVSGVNNFELYNDFGKLTTTSPFPPLGPMPLAGSSFVIGNNEIFSKPLEEFDIALDWEKLPADFAVYYQQYNDYLAASKPQGCSQWLRDLFSREKPIRTPFNNVAFTVDFQLLQQSLWQEFPMAKKHLALTPDGPILEPYKPNSKCVPPADEKAELLFDTTNSTDPVTKKTVDCATTNYSYFAYNVTEPDPALIPDPSIQLAPLKFSDTSISGFVKMVLTGPDLGFGYEIYPNVITYIALLNALAIAKQLLPSQIKPSAALPYVPKLKGFTGNYSASQTHDFQATGDGYPLECYAYSPFASYKINDHVPESPENVHLPIMTIPGIPLYPSFAYPGALFIELADMLPGNMLSLYFELARNLVTDDTAQSVSYSYLTDSGWHELPVLSDTTNDFKCSGIIKFNVPPNMSNGAATMPGKNNWISIAVTGNPTAYSQTVLLKANGFLVERISNLSGPDISNIAAGSITKSSVSIPDIAAVAQPFPSFGNIPAENTSVMNQRVSARIKTKGRALSASDIFTLVLGNFKGIYHVKVIFDAAKNTTNVLLVKAVQSYTDANAFVPLVTLCLESGVQEFLSARISPFANIGVSNFKLEYVCVTVKIDLQPNANLQSVTDSINHSLNLYLSPWITSNLPQTAIDEPITNSAVAGLIAAIDGVLSVLEVSFATYALDEYGNPQYFILTAAEISPSGGYLFVSAMEHNIKTPKQWTNFHT